MITILDSRSYDLPASIELSDLTRLAIEADNGQRPLLRTAPGGLEVSADGTAPDPEMRGWLTLSGVAVEGFLHVTGDLGRLRLVHATIVPGRSPSSTAPRRGLSRRSWWRPATPEATRSIDGFGSRSSRACAGRSNVPGTAQEMVILDSIVDGLGAQAIGGPGGDEAPPLTAERSTLLGTCVVQVPRSE